MVGLQHPGFKKSENLRSSASKIAQLRTLLNVLANPCGRAQLDTGDVVHADRCHRDEAKICRLEKEVRTPMIRRAARVPVGDVQPAQLLHCHQSPGHWSPEAVII